MGKDKKLNVLIISLLGVIFGRIGNRVLENYFGSKGSNLLISISLAIVFFVIVYLLSKRNYLSAVIFIMILAPLVLGAVGMFLDNINLLILGLIVFFIMLAIISIIFPRFIKKD